MILEIESYSGDVLLSGASRSEAELLRQLKTAEQGYDRQTDNFTAYLCRCGQWEVITEDILPDYRYDRDTMRLMKVKGRDNHER